MAKNDVQGQTVGKGLGNTWHIHPQTIFDGAVIWSDMWRIWWMAMTWMSHRRTTSPSHVFAPSRLKSLWNHTTQRTRWSPTVVWYMFPTSLFLYTVFSDGFGGLCASLLNGLLCLSINATAFFFFFRFTLWPGKLWFESGCTRLMDQRLNDAGDVFNFSCEEQ